ncbi:uncharacterized protein LOC116984246 [Amblyraja radiata]|uniref:uncharacterized protein LOC116984246 n=1 Tax=Amblyraja radiata TaxID=386614 RepID=UPI001403AAB7|nr:uncharacterized protein LOC116984246 [Amblyraja radiata]
MPVLSSLIFTGSSSFLLRDMKERNLTFVLDTSVSMHPILDALKRHLKQALFELAYSTTDCKFNIISFSGKVNKYCDVLVPCTPQRVEKALAWIASLECEAGRHTQHALAVAFDDPGCDALYLMTGDKPDTHPETLYTTLLHSAKGRPVHTLYTTQDCAKTEACAFLQKIALLTGASFHAARVCTTGSVDQLIPIFQLDSSDCLGLCCSKTNHSNTFPALNGDFYDPHGPPIVPFGRSALHPKGMKVITSADLIDSIAGELIRGARVLARRKSDGYYYLGRLGREVERCPGRFMVEFDKNKRIRQKSRGRLQETAHYDILHYEDAKRNAVGHGCMVLAPWEASMERYSPGTVLQGKEGRGYRLDHDSSDGLIVNFWNGKTVKVAPGTAVWIPQSLGERMILELQMTTAAKQNLLDTCPDYPLVVPPGYRSSGSRGDEFELVVHSRVPCLRQGLHSHHNHGSCTVPDNLPGQSKPEAKSLVASEIGDGDAGSSSSTVAREELRQSTSPMKGKRVTSAESLLRHITSLQRDIETLVHSDTSLWMSATLPVLDRNNDSPASGALSTSPANGFHHTTAVKREKTRKIIPSSSLQKKTGKKLLQGTQGTAGAGHLSKTQSAGGSQRVRQHLRRDMDR